MLNFLLSIFESNSLADFTELLTFIPTRLYDFGQKYSNLVSTTESVDR